MTPLAEPVRTFAFARGADTRRIVGYGLVLPDRECRPGMEKCSAREVFPGVVVTRNAAGSVSVLDHGHWAGWLHASSGDTWNAFVPYEHLGRFTMETAARVIVAASHSRKAS